MFITKSVFSSLVLLISFTSFISTLARTHDLLDLNSTMRHSMAGRAKARTIDLLDLDSMAGRAKLRHSMAGRAKARTIDLLDLNSTMRRSMAGRAKARTIDLLDLDSTMRHSMAGIAKARTDDLFKLTMRHSMKGRAKNIVILAPRQYSRVLAETEKKIDENSWYLIVRTGSEQIYVQYSVDTYETYFTYAGAIKEAFKFDIPDFDRGAKNIYIKLLGNIRSINEVALWKGSKIIFQVRDLLNSRLVRHKDGMAAEINLDTRFKECARGDENCLSRFTFNDNMEFENRVYNKESFLSVVGNSVLKFFTGIVFELDNKFVIDLQDRLRKSMDRGSSRCLWDREYENICKAVNDMTTAFLRQKKFSKFLTIDDDFRDDMCKSCENVLKAPTISESVLTGRSWRNCFGLCP